MSQDNQSNKLLTTGVLGALIAALCCFTPLLVIGLTGAGLSALVGGTAVITVARQLLAKGFDVIAPMVPEDFKPHRASNEQLKELSKIARYP